MADKKIAETPDFVEGLLISAEEIDKLLNPNKIPPRHLLTKLNAELENLSSEERQELGIYQARVVLMVLAAELALKFLWEQVQEDKTKATDTKHNLSEWFKKLPVHLKAEIQSEYCK